MLEPPGPGFRRCLRPRTQPWFVELRVGLSPPQKPYCVSWDLVAIHRRARGRAVRRAEVDRALRGEEVHPRAERCAGARKALVLRLGGELTGEVILNRLFVSKQRLQRDLCLEHLPGL